MAKGKTRKVILGIRSINTDNIKIFKFGCNNSALGVRVSITVIGQTNAKAEFPVERPLKPHDLLATVYKVMGINTELAFNDLAGRPVAG